MAGRHSEEGPGGMPEPGGGERPDGPPAAAPQPGVAPPGWPRPVHPAPPPGQFPGPAPTWSSGPTAVAYPPPGPVGGYSGGPSAGAAGPVPPPGPYGAGGYGSPGPAAGPLGGPPGRAGYGAPGPYGGWPTSGGGYGPPGSYGAGGPGGVPSSGPYGTGPVPGGQYPAPPAAGPAGGGYGPPTGAGWATGPGLGQAPGGYPSGPPPVGYPPPGGWGPPDYLMSGPGGPRQPRRRSRRALWAVVAAGTAVVLTAGGVTAYGLLAGKSVALDSRVPADVAAYAEVSLDPPAGQKVAALRFFRHFPDLKVGGESGSLIDSLVEPMIADPQERRLFTDNIKPWLGKRAAFAADPQGSRTESIVVLESTDSTKARSGLDAVNRQARPEDRVGYVITDGVAVLGRTQAVAQAAVDAAAAGSLHGNDTFRQDIKAVGEDGVFTAWVDLSRAGDLTKLAVPSAAGAPQPRIDTADVHGRLVASLRFTDTSADVLVRGFGVARSAGGGVSVAPLLANLPADTAAALALSGGDRLVRSAYQQAEKAGLDRALSSLHDSLGLTLPDDIAALVGSSTVLAVAGTPHHVDFGMVSRTDDIDGARRAAQRLASKIRPGTAVSVRPVAAGTVLANSAGYADQLAGSGGLGGTPLFRAALPELDGAQLAGYVDLQRTADLGGAPLPESERAARAIGLTYAAQGDQITMHVRMVVG